MSKKLQNTQLYDQVFWTVINQLPKYLPNLINEAFGILWKNDDGKTLKELLTE